MHILEDNIIEAFIIKWDIKYENKLTSSYNYSRVVCLADFEKIIKKKKNKFFEIGDCIRRFTRT